MANISYNPDVKIINTELACLIGLNEAIALQQLHYWIEKNKTAGVNFRDGRVWTFSTIQEYRDRDFPFWSFNTVRRTITSLANMDFLIKGNYNRMKIDKTIWCAIDYNALENWIAKNADKPSNPASLQNTIIE